MTLACTTQFWENLVLVVVLVSESNALLKWRTLTLKVPRVININFLLTISIHHQEERLGELIIK